MNKAYIRIDWKNYPSIETPLNEQNLNRMDGALDEIDGRVIALDTTKASLTQLSTLFKDVSFDEKTGIFTFTRYNGATVTFDTALEKVALNIYYDPATEKLILPLVDGTQTEVDLSRLITEYEFQDSETIAFKVQADGKVTAIVKEGSIEEKHLRPDYLADIKVEAGRAESAGELAEKSAEAAKESETNAKEAATSAKESEEAADTSAQNAKDSEDAAKLSKDAAASSAASAETSRNEAEKSAQKAKQSEEAAKESKEAAKESENKAKQSEDAAKLSADAAKASEEGVADSAAAAADSAASAEESNTAAQAAKEVASAAATTATTAAASAAGSATAAEQSATAAANSAASVLQSEINAAASAAAAEESEIAAGKSEEAASGSALLSESWAHGGTGIREGEETDNSEFYCNQSHGFRDDAEQFSQSAENAVEQINKKLKMPEFGLNDDGELTVTKDNPYDFDIDDDGNFRWGVKAA